MIDCVVNLVRDALQEHALKEAARLAEVGDRIMILNDRLEWLQTFVRDADQKRRSTKDPFVAIWVRQTRDVAFQMEDLLNDYYCKTAMAEMERSRWSGCFMFLLHPFTQLCTLDDLAKRMNKIDQRLQEIYNNKDAHNIQSIGEISTVWTSCSTVNLAAWDSMEKDMVGFDGYEETLKELLIGPSTDSRAIISIVGESGIGKTKLARKVFDCAEVQRHFKKCSWTHLPPKYRVTEILGQIHKKVSIHVPLWEKAERPKINEGKDISDILRDELADGRYLVVLDGVVSITDWSSIIEALPDARNGSRVLVILKSDCEMVEEFVEPSIKIERLDEERSKNLFLNRVFGMQKYPSWFQETTYGKYVFTLTQGLPLAIVILAGLLRSKESQAEWDSVFNQLKAEGRLKALGRILAMSFDDLPHSLKSCFLYLGALPETKLQFGHKLVRLWISEGFIKPRKGKTLEEIGQLHLKELVSRCLVELVSKDAQGGVSTIVIPGPVHAFMQSEAQEANFFEIHDNVDVIAPSTVRRLSVQNHTEKYVPLRNSFPKLRSLVCEFAEQNYIEVSAIQINQKYHTLGFLHASKFLRVIDLRGLLLKSLPKEIVSMIYLRYLGVNRCGLEELPPSIGNLIYLQTFDVREPEAGDIDQAFWDIPTLRHIFACKIKPPKTMKTNDNLQTLHGVDCAGWDTSLLEKVYNLRSLELEELSNSHSEALLVALGKLELLVHLKLKCSRGSSITSSIFNISILRRLQSLEIDGKLEKAREPGVMHSNSSTLPNLTKLILHNSEICQEFIFMLAKFPRLSYLDLGYSSYHDRTLVFPENGFQGLTELHIGLRKLQEWEIEKMAMPKLVKLFFWYCYSMKMIPDGMNDLRNLKEVMVYQSYKLAKRVKENGGDYQKVQHVPIMRVRWNQVKKK